jgi:FAD/FMN-containing dehydrogenase
MAAISPAATRQLELALSGRLLGPSDPGYDAARRVFNAMIDRRPALIARCQGAEDVSRCVLFARAHGLPVSVKSGGHGVAGRAGCDGGLMIDVSQMKR